MKVGFIGCGNMATAIIKGVVESGTLKSEDIFVYDLDNEKTNQCSAKYGVNLVANEKDLVSNVDAIVLAIKPKNFEGLLPNIDEDLKEKNPLIISIAAGKTLDFISSFFSYRPALVRVMPNINAKVGEAMCAYCDNNLITDAHEKLVCTIFSSIGKVMKLEEQFFPLFGVIAGSAPAFAYLFIDSLARAAVKKGMSKQIALEIAAQTVYGSAKLIMEGNEHPWELIDQVCSPGGTTIEGITSLQADGFESAIERAVDRAVDKDNKI
ncbi:MAG: pyrroline-5-carboxylate reductase [Oscillospiraceae bacterium]